MNADIFFSILGDTDEGYLDCAAKSMIKKTIPIKKQAWLRPTLVAACLLICLVLPLGILWARQTPEAPDIANIPGALPFEKDDRFQSYPMDGKPSSGPAFGEDKQREWAGSIREQYGAVVGSLKSYTSVMVEDGDALYHLMTMEIEVHETLCNMEEAETVTAIYACRYEPNQNGLLAVTTPYQLTKQITNYTDMGEVARKCTEAYQNNTGAGVFVLTSMENDKKELSIEDTVYNLSDYADYQVEACLEYRYDSERVLTVIHDQMLRHPIFLSFDLYLLREHRIADSPHYFDIAELPNATVIEDTAMFENPIPKFQHPSIEEYAESVKKDYAALAANANDFKTVLIQDGEVYWQITTFTLSGIPLCNIEKSFTRVAYVCQYTKQDGKYILATPNRNPLGYETPNLILIETIQRSVYILDSVEEQKWTINGIEYRIFDYADYILCDAFPDGYGSFIYTYSDGYSETDKFPYTLFQKEESVKTTP